MHSSSLASLVLLLVALPAQCDGQDAGKAEPSASPAPLELVAAIELPGVEGRIDHLAVDLARQRAYVAALGNDTVEVLDLEHARPLRSLKGVREPQGILYLPDRDRVVVSSGEDGTLVVYDGDGLETLATVEVGGDADNLRYDAKAGRVWVAYGSGALGVVDADTWKVLGKVPLAAHPESFQLDPDGRHAFVNVPGARHVARVDLEARSVLATWPLEEAGSNFPMAHVPADATSPAVLLVGCRSPARLLVRAAADGAALATLELSGDCDDVFYDARRRRAYVVCGAGQVDVLARSDSGAFVPLARFPTAEGARTGLFVPERDLLLVAVPHRGSQRAEVRVLRVVD